MKPDRSEDERLFIQSAKWRLVHDLGMTEARAYALMRTASMDRRVSMPDLAKAILLLPPGSDVRDVLRAAVNQGA